MLKRLCLIFSIAGALEAQQVVAPTPEQVGPPRGEDTGNYNITNSFETGYRWRLIGGDYGEYRSDVNYANGIRLLGSNLSINSKDGHGTYFDEILLTTIGLGNDPYQSATLRVDKNGLYRYDMVWRLDEFYNPALTVSGGLHLMDTRRRLQDHDLTLLPQSKIKFHLGYSRDTQTGPALSSVEEFTTVGAAYPVFMDVRRQWNEYRLGAEGDVAGFHFIVQRRWDFYKDDSTYNGLGVVASGIPNDLTTLTQFQRFEPYHGSNPGWLGNVFTRHKYWGVNARMTYTSGSRDFALNEFALGTGRIGSPASDQILVTGNAARPVTAGDFSLTLYPTDRLTIVNNTSAHSIRIDGNSVYSEVNTGTNLGTSLDFQYLGIRTVANATDLNYRISKWLGVYTGYHYSDRLIQELDFFQQQNPPGSPFRFLYPRSNHLNAGVAGVRIRPVKPLTINLEGEVGRDNMPLAPISDRNYHILGGRVDYRTRKLQLSTSYHQVYNVNGVSLTVFASHSRAYNANASWSANNWFTLDASYSKLHLDTLGGLAFFAAVPGPPLQTAYSSLYISNIHAGNLGARFGLGRRADLYVGYSITKDTGDGRATAVPAGVTDPVQALLSSVQTFPLTYETPLARVSVKITPKVRWNAGWQFYDYAELFHLFGYNQNFHAHTGYTSVLWSF